MNKIACSQALIKKKSPYFLLVLRLKSFFSFEGRGFNFVLLSLSYCCGSVAQSCLTLCDPMDCSTPGLPVPHHLLEFAQVHVHCINDAVQPSHPLTPSPSALNLSQHQGLFQWVICSHQMTKILELQLHHQSSSEYSGLISFKIDWFDLLAVQETFRSLLQHHSSKASVLWCSAFFMVQVSKPLGDVTPGKTIALTIRTFVGRVLFLLFNTV